MTSDIHLQTEENDQIVNENPESSQTPDDDIENPSSSEGSEENLGSSASTESPGMATSSSSLGASSSSSRPEEGSEMAWYVVHTYSGYENRAKTALEDRIKALKKEKFFGEVIVPEENVIELVKGQKKTTKRRFFPGYILVKMILNDETWHVVKDTPKVTGFIGNKLKPMPVPESDVKKMTSRIAEGELKPRHKVTFQEGESVRVVDGPFSNFNGIVEEVNMDKGKVKVLVSIFGRSTPVELDFIQVEKI